MRKQVAYSGNPAAGPKAADQHDKMHSSQPEIVHSHYNMM